MSKQEDVAELVKAIVHTVEYVGNDMLPVVAGWSWYDALVKYAPEEADRFARNPIHFPASPNSETSKP